MKIPLLLTLFLTVLVSCTDDLSLAPSAQNRNLNTNATASLTPVPTGDYVWTLMPRYNDADGITCYTDMNVTPQLNTCKAIEINGDIYGFAGSDFYQRQRKLNKSTKQWETFSQTVSSAMKTALQRTNYLFSYGNKMYSGLWRAGNEGYYPGIVYSVNHLTGTITEVAPFPGTATVDFISFVVGNKGYVMGGFTTSYVMSPQFWEYNFDTNVWTNKGTIPGGVRAGGSAFVVGNDVYLGLGFTRFEGDGYQSGYSRDWIKFNPSNATAITTLQSFPGVRRKNAQGFLLNNKIYLGWGQDSEIDGATEDTDDFWEYNPSTNVWKEKAKCPSNVGVRDNRAAFVQGNAGYVVIGCLSSLWRYSNSSVVPMPPGTGPVPVPTNP